MYFKEIFRGVVIWISGLVNKVMNFRNVKKFSTVPLLAYQKGVSIRLTHSLMQTLPERCACNSIISVAWMLLLAINKQTNKHPATPSNIIVFEYSVFKSVLLCFVYCLSVILQINPLATLNTYLPALCLFMYTRMAWHAIMLIIYGNKGSVVFVHRTLIGSGHNLIMGEVRLVGSWV